MTLKGVIKLIKPIQQISATFSKREFVIETQEQYPQSIQLELHGDRVDIIDSFAEGQEVECHINIKGRLWVSPQGEDKYFNTIVCWKIMTPTSENKPQSTAPTFEPVNDQGFSPIPNLGKEEDEADDLPF
jgi:hypothetical protein